MTNLFRLGTKDFLSVRKLIPQNIKYIIKKQTSVWVELELLSEPDVDIVAGIMKENNCPFSALVMSSPR